MKDNKPLYEKIYIWIGIVAGICAILGISAFGGLSLLDNSETHDIAINLESNETDDQSPIIQGGSNNITYNNYYANILSEPTTSIETKTSDIETEAQFTLGQTSQNNFNKEENNNVQEMYFDDEISSISEDELLINRNLDYINKSKMKYSNSDTIIIKNDKIWFFTYEKAGFIYSNLLETEDYYELIGKCVFPEKIIILDYLSDRIIYSFTLDESVAVSFYPENQNKFYCVLFHEDYDICVTPPIQVIGGEDDYFLWVGLEKKSSKYTPMVQIHLNIFDINNHDNKLNTELQFTNYSEYHVLLEMRNKHSEELIPALKLRLPDSGIISLENYSYFRLNTDYAVEVSLYQNPEDYFELARQTVDCIGVYSNVQEIFFHLDDSLDTGSKIE